MFLLKYLINILDVWTAENSNLNLRAVLATYLETSLSSSDTRLTVMELNLSEFLKLSNH